MTQELREAIAALLIIARDSKEETIRDFALNSFRNAIPQVHHRPDDGMSCGGAGQGDGLGTCLFFI